MSEREHSVGRDGAVHEVELPGIEVRIPATPIQLSALRAVAADLAMRQDFHLDAISDLRMAVDEAATTLIGRAAAGSTLVCRFSPAPDGIGVSVSVRSPDGSALRKDTFSWRVLRTLTDAVSVQITPNGTSEDTHVVRIDLVKRHHGAVAG